MKAKWLILAVVVLGLVVAHSVGFAAPPTILPTQSTAFNAAIATSTNGELGLYLVGPWSNKEISGEVVATHILLVNPISTNKWAFVSIWGNDETPLTCLGVQLTPNGTYDLSFSGLIFGYEFGAVKVLVTNDNGNPDLGLVGYRKEVHKLTNFLTTGTGCPPGPSRDTVVSLSVSEIRLQPIPPKVLFSDRTPQDAVPDEVKNIACLCGVDGGNFGTCP